MGKLAIFDYSTTSVHIYNEELSESEQDNIEEIISDLGFYSGDCYYMFEDTIEVVEHEETLK